MASVVIIMLGQYLIFDTITLSTTLQLFSRQPGVVRLDLTNHQISKVTIDNPRHEKVREHVHSFFIRTSKLELSHITKNIRKLS